MSKAQFFLLNLLLVMAAALTTAGFLSSRKVRRELPAQVASEESETGRKRARARSAADAQTAALAELLWQKNLFVPERSPSIRTPDDDPSAAPAGPAEMELTGIGRIADRQAAIIIVNSRGRSVRRGIGGQPPPPAADTPKKKIYSIGDEIEDTGFTLAEIKIDKQFHDKETRSYGLYEVVLNDPHGGTKTLRMQTGDTASATRSASAASAQEKIKAVVIAPPLRDATAPPPPPPSADGTTAEISPATPNIVVGGGGAPDETPGKPVAEMTREERLKWAIETRRRHMQERAAEQAAPK